ncbi:hypothetical protein M422DRAFT_158478 [Sphaerobolus stellatus SS14]|nr:hypothetical protein M422DRAFT_158478 [Sphaerobolus stellatus SS14]
MPAELRPQSPSQYSVNDPLAFAIRPPPYESSSEREIRLTKEAEARRVSERIDEEIRIDRERIKKSKASGEVKLLLLGQAESGKSTLQKQFQLMHAPASLESERNSWIPVIYLNIIKAVRMILDTLANFEGDFSEGGNDWELANARLHLAALVGMENGLATRLSQAAGVSTNDTRGRAFVRKGWQKSVRSLSPRNGKAPATDLDALDSFLDDPAARLLIASKDDIKHLWRNIPAKELIKKRRLRLEDCAEFFLENIDRIASPEYLPSMDDIMRARIQTMGIAEHEFEITLGSKAVKWLLYDVGGARGQRHKWIPYFEDANAIIFLAPISAFDQYLDEDPKTNRIDDSLQLFTQICSNILLKKVHLVLFLNKTDILKEKLESGVPLNKFITSYGDRPNTYEDICNYFKAHFAQVHRRNNDQKRVLYIHMTSVVDTKATQQIIVNVRDSIFRGYLKVKPFHIYIFLSI